MSQIIELGLSTPKISVPTEMAIKVEEYKIPGTDSSKGNDFSGDSGTFFIKEPGVSSCLLETQIVADADPNRVFNITLSGGCGTEFTRDVIRVTLQNADGTVITRDFTYVDNVVTVEIPDGYDVDPRGYWIKYEYELGILSRSQQYPGRYKSSDWRQIADLTPPGDYMDVIFSLTGLSGITPSLPDTYADLLDCGTGCYSLVSGTGLFINGISRMNPIGAWAGTNNVIYLPGGGPIIESYVVTCSVPYRITYSFARSGSSYLLELGTYQYPHDGICDQLNATLNAVTDGGLTFSATNHDSWPGPSVYQDFPATCDPVTHFISASFTEPPDMDFVITNLSRLQIELSWDF